MKTIKGDLIALAEDGEFDVIVQGCNCFNTMGSGLAKQIREKYPAAYEADCQTVKGDYNKLGNYTSTVIPVLPWTEQEFVVVNAYTQYDYNRPGETKEVFEYLALKMILRKLYHAYPNARYGFPLIGCGLARADKSKVLTILEAMDNSVSRNGGSVTVVEWSES